MRNVHVCSVSFLHIWIRKGVVARMNQYHCRKSTFLCDLYTIYYLKPTRRWDTTKEELATASTGVADIDAFKDAVAEASEEVIKSGEKMAELYTAWKNEQNVLAELTELAVQMKAEAEKIEEASKKAEPAGKAVKGLKNPKALMTANKVISKSSNVVSLDTKEATFQLSVVTEMIKLISGK